MQPIFRMVVCSDVHYQEGKPNEPARFEKGIQQAYDYAAGEAYDKIDALYVVGDFATSGSEAEMQMFKASIDKCVRNETQITLTLASHEFRYGEAEALARFDRIFGMEKDTHKVINGLHLIALTRQDGCRIREKKQTWLKEQLKKAAADDPYKPIFVFQHPHLTDTVYGSINWGEDDIIEILMDYPQVIDFSGHSHAPINDPRSIHQKYFTSMGTGSLSYFELDEFDKRGGTVPPDAENCAQYLIVEVFPDNAVLIKPFDILSGMFFHAGYYIEKPSDPETFIYTDARYKTTEKPVFPENTGFTVETHDHTVKLHFYQAYIKDRVDSYTIVVKSKNDGHIVKQMNISSSYYLNPMPRDRSLVFDLDEAGAYTVEVTANSFWDTCSDKITASFSVD